MTPPNIPAIYQTKPWAETMIEAGGYDDLDAYAIGAGAILVSHRKATIRRPRYIVTLADGDGIATLLDSSGKAYETAGVRPEHLEHEIGCLRERLVGDLQQAFDL